MSATDDIAPLRLAGLLATARYGRSLEVLASTGSTNDDAMRRAQADAPSGHVVLADHQLAGRGARDRSWVSPPGTDLYLSIVDRPRVEQAKLPPLTLAVGLGVADAVDELLSGTGAPGSEVKWPNDVRLGGRKCAGVLVEAVTAGERIVAVVIGIGLDVNRKNWPDDLVDEATSLCEVRADGKPLDRGVAFATLLAAVERWVDRFVAQGVAPIVTALDARLAFRDRRVHCEGVEGTLLGIAPTGAVRIATAGGVRELVTGTLRLVGPLAPGPGDARGGT